jgi:hypothetical protein
MPTVYWKWKVVGNHPAWDRVPPYPMTEAQAEQWASRWGCVVERIAGTEYHSDGAAMGGSHRR